MTRQVAIFQRRLTHYRVPLFESLRSELLAHRIRLQVVYGQPTLEEETKCDKGSLDWGEFVRNRYLRLGSITLCWQPCPPSARGADLVIVTQENRLISNYPLLARQHLGGPPVAFWGHGQNFQRTSLTGPTETFRRWVSCQAAWWFAYTELSRSRVSAMGFPSSRITVLNNSIDTGDLQGQCDAVSIADLEAARQVLGAHARRYGVFVGSLYTEKRLNFLLSAADRIRQSIPDFGLFIVGDGPDRENVMRWCRERPWACWVGARFGAEKAVFVKAAEIMLNPGLVGLGIIDSFVCGVPMITTDCGSHSPEIAYLRTGINGVITPDSLDSFCTAAVRVFSDSDLQRALQAGCHDSARVYTLENMTHRFAEGILNCLEATK